MQNIPWSWRRKFGIYHRQDYGKDVLKELRKICTYMPSTILSAFPAYVWWMYNELASWHCILQGLPWQLMLALPGFHLFQSSHTCWLLGNKNLCHGSKLRWKSTKDTERFHCRQSGHRAWEGSPYTYAFIIDCVPSLMLPEFLPYKWVFGWKTHYGWSPDILGVHMMSVAVVMTTCTAFCQVSTSCSYVLQGQSLDTHRQTDEQTDKYTDRQIHRHAHTPHHI